FRLDLPQLCVFSRFLGRQPLQQTQVIGQELFLACQVALQSHYVIDEGAVVRRDELEVFVTVEQVGEALCAEQDLHRVQRTLLVDPAQTLLEQGGAFSQALSSLAQHSRG